MYRQLLKVAPRAPKYAWRSSQSTEPIDTNLVDVTVEFHLPETRPDRLAALGEAYSAAYAKLWDEDEVMMQARERALARRTTPDRTAPALDLGAEQAVRAMLPMPFRRSHVPTDRP